MTDEKVATNRMREEWHGIDLETRRLCLEVILNGKLGAAFAFSNNNILHSYLQL